MVCLRALVVCPQTCHHFRRRTWVVAHHLKECRHSPSHRRATLAHLREVCPFHLQVACRLEGHPEARLAGILLDHRDVRSDPMQNKFHLALTMTNTNLYSMV